MLPAINLLYHEGLWYPWMKLEQNRIDVRRDEWVSAHRLLAPLQRRGDGKLDALGVKQRDPGDRIASGVDHPACHPNNDIRIGIRPERHLIAELEPSGGIGNHLVVAFGDSMPCNQGRRPAETPRFIALYVKPQGPAIRDG